MDTGENYFHLVPKHFLVPMLSSGKTFFLIIAVLGGVFESCSFTPVLPHALICLTEVKNRHMVGSKSTTEREIEGEQVA